MSVTRAVRLTFLCSAAALVACGRTPPRLAAPDPASLAAQSHVDIQVPAAAAPQAQPAAPAAPSAGSAPEATKAAQDAAPQPLDAGVAGDASKDPRLAEKLTLPADFNKAKTADKTLSAASGGSKAGKRRKRGVRAMCCGWGDWGGGSSSDLANKVYGYFGWSNANLYYDSYNGAIAGSLDGRSVYIEDGDSDLYGSIGWTTVNLHRYSSWWSSTVTGYLGGHYVNMSVNNGSLKGYEGGTYINTGIGWSGALSGSYGGYGVKVSDSGDYLSGNFGYRSVAISEGYGSYSGYVGNKTVNLYSDMGSSIFLRRLPLMAANEWMIISTLTSFFD